MGKERPDPVGCTGCRGQKVMKRRSFNRARRVIKSQKENVGKRGGVSSTSSVSFHDTCLYLV